MRSLTLLEEIWSDGVSLLDGAGTIAARRTDCYVAAQIQQYSDGSEVIIGDVELANRCRTSMPL